MALDLLFLDADDTLWHNNRHFDVAERAFFEMTAPFVAAGAAREQLDAVNARNLRLYGYGAKSFTLSMIETATEICGEKLTPAMVRTMLAAGRDLLAHPVELLDGVEETMDLLSDRVRMVLCTKGDLLHQEAKLAASGLGRFFHGVEIVSDKRASTFSALCERYGVVPDRAGMAGDSMRSDILPMIEAGGWAAFLPTARVWSHEHAEAPERHPRFARLSRFTQLPDWIDSIAA